MKSADIKIEDTKKDKKETKIKQDEIIVETEDMKEDEIKREAETKQQTKKYNVLIGMVGKVKKGGIIELSDEDAEFLLKEGYVEEV